MKQPLLSFNNGEVSPYLRHRTDFEKTGSSADTVENFICTPYGAITKRPGIQFVSNSIFAGQNSRMFPFVSTDGSRYLLVFTEDKLTVKRTDGTTAQVIDFLTFVSPTTPPSPAPAGFFSAPLRLLQVAALNDVLFITHPESHPLRLSRLADDDWALEFIPFTRAPMRDPNEDETQQISILSHPIAANWITAISYDAGDTVFKNGAEWTCRADHTSGAATEPGIGADWKGSWRRKIYEPGAPITISPVNASITSLVRRYLYHETASPIGLSTVWICTATHTPYSWTQEPNRAANAAELGVPHNWLPVLGSAGISRPAGSYCTSTGGHIHLNVSGAPAANSPSTPTSNATWLYIRPLTNDYDWENTITPATTGNVYSYENVAYRALTDVTPDWKNETGGTPTMEDDTGLDTDFTDPALWERIDFFLPEHAANAASPGTTFQLSPRRDERDFQIELSAITANNGLFSTPITVQGNWNINTFGTWTGTFNIQRSTDNGSTWTTIRSYEAKNDRNIAESGQELSPALLRIGFTSTADTAASGAQRAVLAPERQAITGYALATTYVNSGQMTGTASTALMSGLTSEWAEGAFSRVRGFPSALALHESRLAFAGTAANPVSIWLSQTEDFLNFQIGADDTDAVFATLAAPFQYPIRWLVSQRRLFLGTSNALWVVGSETSDAPLSPTSFNARLYTSTGTDNLQPLLSSDSIFFLDRKGARLHQLNFSEDIGSYEPMDLSRLAEHLTQPGIIGYAYAQTREPMVYAVTREGKLLMFSYSRRDNIMAWTQHSTLLGSFRDVAVIPSDDGDDEIFFLIDDDPAAPATISHIGRFPQHWQEIMETGQNPDEAADAPFPWFYLDGLGVLNRNGQTIPSPNAILGRALHVGVVAGDGTLTLNTGLVAPDLMVAPVDTVMTIGVNGRYLIGFKIHSTYKSLPIDIPAGDGATHSGRKRINKVSLSLYRSRGGSVSANSSARPIPFTANDGILFNGWADTVVDLGHYDDAQLTITHSDPYPFTVRAALIEFQVTQR